MLKKQMVDTGTIEVTFVLPAKQWTEPVSVVGDFNGWDPLAHPLRKRSNGTRSVKVVVPAGRSYRFKYLGDGGRWFCEPDADAVEPNEFSALNSVVVA